MVIGETIRNPRAPHRGRFILMAVLIALGVLAGGSARAESSRVGHAPGLPRTDGLLRAVVRDGLVDYGLLEEQRHRLAMSLEEIAGMPPARLAQLPARVRLAFYLNAYNAATLDLVARERGKRGGRLTSIKEIPGAWSRPTWNVAGIKRTLDQIEHEIIRREFHEPRIHMALVCASISCPALRPEAYGGVELERQLEAASLAFVNDSTRNRFIPREGKIRISKIFDWYGEDFAGVYRDEELEGLYGKKNGAVLAFAARYLPPETSAAWRARRVPVEYLPYDWSLNAAPASAK